jgi:hypothetical protein
MTGQERVDYDGVPWFIKVLLGVIAIVVAAVLVLDLIHILSAL